MGLSNLRSCHGVGRPLGGAVKRTPDFLLRYTEEMRNELLMVVLLLGDFDRDLRVFSLTLHEFFDFLVRHRSRIRNLVVETDVSLIEVHGLA